MAVGTNAAIMRSYNRRVVIEAIRRLGDASRADVARATDLSLQAVSTIFGRLEREGWIVERGRRSTERGQPPLVYRLDTEGLALVGVTVDLDGVTTASVDLNGRVAHRRLRAAVRPGPDEVREIVLEHLGAIETLERSAGRIIVGVGVALPGTPEAGSGRVRRMPHIEGWEGASLPEALAPDVPYPVHVANDAIAAGLGEAWFAPDGNGADTFFVFFAHGLNGAMIRGRRPYGGIWGITGKFGHIPVVPDGVRCSACGGRGCLECYASLLALLRRLGLPVSADAIERIAELHARGDERIGAWLDTASERIVTALLAVENLFDPASVVFGGRVPEGMLRDLVGRLERAVAPRRMTIKETHPVYRTSTFGRDAALVGAATLSLYLAFSPDIDLVIETRKEAAIQIPAT